MRAPRKANVVKLDNPAWVRFSQPPITAPGVQRGNDLDEAPGKEFVSHNASEGIEPRNYSISHPGQGFHMPEANIGICEIRRVYIGEPGSESVAGKRTVYVGTWENRIAPNGSCKGAGKVTKQYGVSVVGLTHSRGVGRVMPVESRFTRHSKGSALVRKDEVGHSPVTELEVTMETLQSFISEIAIRHSMSYEVIEVSINEEPVAGNPHGGFCEGHASPYTEFIKTQSLLN
jgi:hypothetical protein